MPNFFRSLMPTLFGFLGGLLAACAVGATRADPPAQEGASGVRVQEVLRANKIELVAKNGKVLGTWECENLGDEHWKVSLSLGEYDSVTGGEGMMLSSEYPYRTAPALEHWVNRGARSKIELGNEARGQRTLLNSGGLYLTAPNDAESWRSISPDDIMELNLTPSYGITFGGRFELVALRKGETRLRLSSPLSKEFSGKSAAIYLPANDTERARLEIYDPASDNDDDTAVFPPTKKKEEKQENED